MAEANTAEVEAKVNAAFGAGFGDTPPAPAEKVVETPAPEAAKPTPKAEPKASTPVAVPDRAVKYTRVPQKDWDNLKAALLKVPNLESQIIKLVGSTPKADQIAAQVLESVRSQTPAGLNVEMSDEDFAELTADYPELAKSTRAALERIFKKANVKGTGTAATPPAEPVDAKAAAREVLREEQAEDLAEAYPNWQEIVGKPPKPGDAPNETVDFRKWLATKDPDYQKRISGTLSPAVLQRSLNLFVKETSSLLAAPSAPAKPDRAAARRAVIEDAVTPRAEGNPPPPAQPQSVDDAFRAGFKAAARH